MLGTDRRPLALRPSGSPQGADTARVRSGPALPCLPSAPRRTAQLELPLRPRR